MKRTLNTRKRSAVALTCLWLLLLSPLAPRASLAAVTYPTLRKGDSGSAVIVLQKALESLGYNPGAVDGKYGKATIKAIKYFQESVKLTADGVAGNKTQTALYKKAGITVAPAVSGATAADAKATDTPSSSGSKSGYATLRYGDKGAAVKKLQTALTALGFDANGIDGSYGAGTQRAVKQFQKKYKLKQDGVAGNATQTLLYQKSSAETTPAVTPKPTTSGDTSVLTRTLKPGHIGADVLLVQERLIALGYNPGAADGSYGTNTATAVKAFQERSKLYADGFAGQQTFKKLFADNAKKAADAEAPAPTPTPTPEPTDPPADAVYETLRLNSSGAAVKALQKKLIALKYDLTATGKYDSQTQAAVLAFQLLNGLASDGVAGQQTQAKLYSGTAKKYSASALTNDATGAPSKSKIQLLHWNNVVKPSVRTGQSILIYEPKSGLSWKLKLYSLGRHADSEPLTLADTNTMNKAFGTVSWTPKAVYVKLPDGRWTLATMHNVPHLSGSVSTNGFNGHLCVHFLRDMSEVSVNDPNYGVQHQNALRAAWKSLTGNVVN